MPPPTGTNQPPPTMDQTKCEVLAILASATKLPTIRDQYRRLSTVAAMVNHRLTVIERTLTEQ